ncbi:uncharacterized protein LOC134205503 [Armigeres subalbatus]|uniref:uncharacterized protein LOC134205503 n=1 Tax=Armigeres subalbatus TaxID=124917 RepID=UPI002ED56B45
MTDTEDILRPLSRRELVDLQNLYFEKSPLELPYYFIIKNQLTWDDKINQVGQKVDSRCLSVRAYLKFYTPRCGNPKETGTFVAITSDEDPTIYFHTLQEHHSQLLKYLSETRYINFSCSPVFACVSDNHIPVLDALLEKVNCIGEELSDCSYYMMTNEKALQQSYEVPNDVIMKQLVPSNSTLMNERWPHRYPNSEKYIELLIQLNGGLGLFDRDNDEIVGWVLKNEFAGVGHLQIMPNYRQKGYGMILAKAMTKKIALEDGGIVNAFIVDKNTNSRLLFGKLGYELIAGSNWIRANFTQKSNEANI